MDIVVGRKYRMKGNYSKEDTYDYDIVESLNEKFVALRLVRRGGIVSSDTDVFDRHIFERDFIPYNNIINTPKEEV